MPPGWDQPADCAPAADCPRARSRIRDTSRRQPPSDRCDHTSAWCRHGCPHRETHPPPPVTQDGRGDRDRPVEVDDVRAPVPRATPNTAIRANASGSGPSSQRRDRVRRGRRCPQRCFPSPSVNARARSGSMAPVSSRDPRRRHRTGALLFREHTIASIRSRPQRVAGEHTERSTSNATSADATPSGPSKAPPPGTESRWLPVTTASAWVPSGACQAQIAPLRSTSTSRPRFSAVCDEPLPKLVFGCRIHRPRVPATLRVPPDVLDLASSPATVSTGAAARSLAHRISPAPTYG